MTLLFSSLPTLAASRSHLTDVNPAAPTADEKPGFCVHDYIVPSCKWIYLAAERWHGYEDVCDGWRRSDKIRQICHHQSQCYSYNILLASVLEAERAIVLSARCKAIKTTLENEANLPNISINYRVTL